MIRATFDILGDRKFLPHNLLNILYAHMFTAEISEQELDDDVDLWDSFVIAACTIVNISDTHHTLYGAKFLHSIVNLP